MRALLLLTAALCAPARGATRSYTFKLENLETDADGLSRNAVMINGQTPGPVITAKKHDDIEVLVVNNLTDNSMPRGTSVHWHGLFLSNGAAAQDGVAWVTQCPIAYNDTYTYRFNVGEQTGTFWYHSHLTSQYCDGMRGPLIIYDDSDPLRHLYDVDDESTVLTLNEWYDEPSPRAFNFALPPQSMMLNGLGRGFFGSHQLSVVKVAKNKRYRLRVINAGCMASFEFMIDGHPLTVIEIDGILVNPHPVDSVIMYPGQRVSVVVNANQTVDSYYIRAWATWEGHVIQDYPDHVAILQYEEVENEPPLTRKRVPAKRRLLNEEDLVPYGIPPQTPQEPDIKLNLNVTIWEDTYNINNRSYEPPSIPVLLQLLNGADIRDMLGKGAYMTLPKNKLVEISLPGGSPLGPHPFHLHGHAFQVVRSVGSTKYNYVNPPIRDVVNTGGAGDNVTIRFRTDNPGPWFLHCHVEFHLEGGLGIIFLEEPSDQRTLGHYPQEWKDLCPKWTKASTEGKKYSKLIWPGKERSRFLFTPGSAPIDE